MWNLSLTTYAEVKDAAEGAMDKAGDLAEGAKDIAENVVDKAKDALDDDKTSA